MERTCPSATQPFKVCSWEQPFLWVINSLTPGSKPSKLLAVEEVIWEGQLLAPHCPIKLGFSRGGSYGPQSCRKPPSQPACCQEIWASTVALLRGAHTYSLLRPTSDWENFTLIHHLACSWLWSSLSTAQSSALGFFLFRLLHSWDSSLQGTQDRLSEWFF